MELAKKLLPLGLVVVSAIIVLKGNNSNDALASVKKL